MRKGGRPGVPVGLTSYSVSHPHHSRSFPVPLLWGFQQHPTDWPFSFPSDDIPIQQTLTILVSFFQLDPFPFFGSFPKLDFWFRSISK